MKTIAENRRAGFEYFLLDKYEAGIVLTGDEIKSVRLGSFSIAESFAFIKDNECFLRNTYIKEYGNAFNVTRKKSEERRDRKLLLHKIEIEKIRKKLETEHLTLVPVKAYFKGSNLKVEIAVAKGKKLYDKREALKKKDVDKKLRRE